MLIALMTILFLGGGSAAMLEYIGETEDAIKVVMEKDDRRKGALATVKEMKKRTKARNKQVKKTSKELSAVLANHDSSLADLDAVWDVYYTEVEAYNREMLDLRYELHDRLTRDEWGEIFDEDRPEN